MVTKVMISVSSFMVSFLDIFWWGGGGVFLLFHNGSSRHHFIYELEIGQLNFVEQWEPLLIHILGKGEYSPFSLHQVHYTSLSVLYSSDRTYMRFGILYEYYTCRPLFKHRIYSLVHLGPTYSQLSCSFPYIAGLSGTRYSASSALIFFIALWSPLVGFFPVVKSVSYYPSMPDTLSDYPSRITGVNTSSVIQCTFKAIVAAIGDIVGMPIFMVSPVIS